MTLRRNFPSVCRLALAALVPGFWVGSLHAQQRPAEITPQLASQAPYRDSGRIEFQQGRHEYIGTASYIRRYTGLTAGHILYDPNAGFSTNLHYAAALYGDAIYDTTIGYFAVLAGYQAAADRYGDDSDQAFDQDMGYLVFTDPALNNEWAAWSDRPDDLLSTGPFLLFGYAAESFTGDELASIQHQTPYREDVPPGLFQSRAYYTEGGMSGGPVYVPAPGGGMTIAAVNVAGTSYGQPAYSGARAITPAETPLLRAAEYEQGIISGGVIKGPAVVSAGSSVKYKTGLTFPDGPQVNNPVSAQYDADVKLVAKGPYKKVVVVTKAKPGKYFVAFPASVPAGTQIPLELLRTALASKGQTPLQTLTVTVQ